MKKLILTLLLGGLIIAPELLLEDRFQMQNLFHFSVSFSASMASFTAPMTPWLSLRLTPTI